MGFKQFSLLISIRTVFVMLTLILLTSLISTPGYHAATLLISIFLILQCISIYKFVSKTNSELTRFLDAARYADYSQRFEFTNMGAGFGELGHAFTDILKRFQVNRAGQEEQLRHLKAMIEHVPVPLISIHGDGAVTLWNNSSRRLFGSNPLNRIEDLQQFGSEFANHLTTTSVGERRLVTFEADGMEQQLTVSATEITIAGKKEKLLSMQDIQSELDVVQLQSWQDLVRVLTHEIMNSITPVASLAKTAVDLLDDAKAKITEHPEALEELADVSDAIQTVARRSDGLMKFVGSYRRLTRLPPPTKKLVSIQTLLTEAKTIATQHWDDKGISLDTKIVPSELDIMVDFDMIEQVLINLLQNAEQALIEVSSPEVSINASLNKRGHVVIAIEDNGPGIDDELSKKIFVPFFTTKRKGSGVGLALTRQIMIAHGGKVKLERSELGGALFKLIF
jgi:two-component system nitrogen regulation sensor histidine kinase NtrY